MPDFKYLYTTVDGRIGRKQWWIGIAILIVIAIALGYLVGPYSFLARVIGLLFAAAGVCLHAKRLHDRGKSAWWVLLILAGSLPWLPSLVGLGIFIWIIVDLGILKGQEGPNEYGPEPPTA